MLPVPTIDQEQINQEQQKPVRVMLDMAEARIKTWIKLMKTPTGNLEWLTFLLRKLLPYHKKCDFGHMYGSYITTCKFEKGRVCMKVFESISEHFLCQKKILFTINDAYKKFTELYQSTTNLSVRRKKFPWNVLLWQEYSHILVMKSNVFTSSLALYSKCKRSCQSLSRTAQRKINK